MERQSKFNLGSNFLHIGGGEHIPLRNIRTVEILTDADRAQMAERYPEARTDFRYRVQFWNRTQRLALSLDTAPGTFVEVDKGVLMPIANLAGIKPLTEDDKARLRERYPQAERPFESRIEGADGQSFLSTWTVAQITGLGEEALTHDRSGQATRRDGAAPRPAG